MKMILLAVSGLLATFSLQAQTNAPVTSAATPSGETTAKPSPAFPVPNALPANNSNSSATPATNAPPASHSPESAAVRNQTQSQRLQRMSDALAAQKPNPRDLEQHRTTGLFPSFYRTVKTGGNPFQLINPFAPVTPDEKDYGAVRSRVFDDPKTHASPGIDVLSVNY